MFQPNAQTRYPNYLLFGWERDDGDFECLVSMNGETIEQETWNHLVEQTYGILVMTQASDILVLERQDLVEVMTEPWAESRCVEVIFE